ncbi:hypothetical protein M438DRAFT_193208 [Aureobasidium pullulans EXF-150]|uniref:Uncharacterized protein n=1 Tax=Aureobasidium pullulans EXF-150 TaxID=1043002 RepID=A0A074YEM0_AURPU|nr:uncharacterized protein M438DRAFT_193208 [Aureobasidium pullulans EXF-150]KEQ85296.1 hypothetical protein M438DRAFT_193208 [Aureobasidium pullulans EXF-150]
MSRRDQMPSSSTSSISTCLSAFSACCPLVSPGPIFSNSASFSISSATFLASL